MSEWGMVSFYYDYVVEDPRGRRNPRRIRGLVNRVYKYPGPAGMILHAYYGLNYFLGHKDERNWNPDGTLCESSYSTWAELSAAFDVLFDFHHLEPGGKGMEPFLVQKAPMEEIRHNLFNCEGSDGWLNITFTGDSQNGYELKYGYDYHNNNKPADIRQIAEKIQVDSDEDRELLEGVVDFFDTSASLMNDEEFQSFYETGENYLGEVIAEKVRQEEKSEEIKAYKGQRIEIEDAGLSVRSYNCLKRAGFKYLDELEGKTVEDLSEVPHLGRKCVDELIQVCEKYGIKTGIGYIED